MYVYLSYSFVFTPALLFNLCPSIFPGLRVHASFPSLFLSTWHFYLTKFPLRRVLLSNSKRGNKKWPPHFACPCRKEREREIEGNASLWVCVRERERVGKSLTYCVDVCLLCACERERERERAWVMYARLLCESLATRFTFYNNKMCVWDVRNGCRRQRGRERDGMNAKKGQMVVVCLGRLREREREKEREGMLEL